MVRTKKKNMKGGSVKVPKGSLEGPKSSMKRRGSTPTAIEGKKKAPPPPILRKASLTTGPPKPIDINKGTMPVEGNRKLPEDAGYFEAAAPKPESAYMTVESKLPKDTGYMTFEPPKDAGYMTEPPKHTGYMQIYAEPKLTKSPYINANPIYGFIPGPIPEKKLNYPEAIKKVHPFEKPINTSPTKNSIYKYLTSTGTQSSDYSARLARINPETLSKLNGDDSLKYLKKNFTAVKADEINKFFGEELKGTTTPAEKQAKIKEILTDFTTQASKNNKAKHTVMTNIRTFKNSAVSTQRQRRTNRSTNLEKSLSGQLKSARAALTTETNRKPLKQLSAENEPNPNRRINPNYSSNPKRSKPEENIYAQIGELPKTQLEEALANEMKRINPAPPLPPPRRGSNPNNLYEVIEHNKKVKNRLKQMKTVTNLTSPGGLYSE
jgi:hypothetical protein